MVSVSVKISEFSPLLAVAPIKAQFYTTVNILDIETVGNSWKGPVSQCCVHLIYSIVESEK